MNINGRTHTASVAQEARRCRAIERDCNRQPEASYFSLTSADDCTIGARGYDRRLG
jgi:hypothetical protein